jgi:hypothetical protein
MVAALALSAVLGSGEWVEAGQTTFVRLQAILASRTSTTFDPRLVDLKPELNGLPFTGYELINLQSCRLESGDQCQMEIPGGGYVHVATTQCTDRHLKMRLLLNQKNRPVFNADVKLNRNAGILLKSARTAAGTIILSIRTSEVPLSDGAVAATAPH